MDTNNDKEDRYKAYRRDRDAEAKPLDYFRDSNSPLKLIIVTAKLLTGFDIKSQKFRNRNPVALFFPLPRRAADGRD